MLKLNKFIIFSVLIVSLMSIVIAIDMECAQIIDGDFYDLGLLNNPDM